MSRWHPRFLEDVLVLITEYSILPLYHFIASYLVNHRPYQHTTSQPLLITTNHIYKPSCRNHVNLDTFSHLLCRNHNLVTAQYATTTFNHFCMVRNMVSTIYKISAWFRYTSINRQTRRSSTSTNPIYLWLILLQKIHSQYQVGWQSMCSVLPYS